MKTITMKNKLALTALVFVGVIVLAPMMSFAQSTTTSATSTLPNSPSSSTSTAPILVDPNLFNPNFNANFAPSSSAPTSSTIIISSTTLPTTTTTTSTTTAVNNSSNLIPAPVNTSPYPLGFGPFYYDFPASPFTLVGKPSSDLAQVQNLQVGAQNGQTQVGEADTAPIVKLSVRTTLTGGLIINWGSIGANSCVASGSWAGSRSTTGTENVSTAGPTYTLTCVNQYGSASVTRQTGLGAARIRPVAPQNIVPPIQSAPAPIVVPVTNTSTSTVATSSPQATTTTPILPFDNSIGSSTVSTTTSGQSGTSTVPLTPVVEPLNSSPTTTPSASTTTSTTTFPLTPASASTSTATSTN